MEPATVVIDNGTGFTKMGYAGNMEPSYIIPTRIATNETKKSAAGGAAAAKFLNHELDFHIGNAANTCPTSYHRRSLLKHGQIADWEGIEKFWHKSIYDYIRCEPEEHKFILTEPPMNSPENREQMAEIMFETFNVKGLFIGVQATLALYAQIAGPNRAGGDLDNLTADALTGTVIDSGDGVTHVFPVVYGQVIESAVKHIPLAGSDITSFVRDQMTARGEIFRPEDGNEIATKIKEKYGYVCKDVLKEYGKFDKKDEDADGRMKQSSKFKKLEFTTLNKNKVSIDVGYERFLGPEMFFHPEFIHKDWTTPLGEVVDNSIQKCPVDTRVQLYENIVLSGGSTLFQGFDKRLQGQVQNILDGRMKKYNEMSGGNEKMKANCDQNLVQAYAVWFGGSVLGANDGFRCKTREMYQEYGPSVCRQNAIFQE